MSMPHVAQIDRLGVEFVVGIRDLQLAFAEGEKQLLSVRAGRKIHQMLFEQLFLALLEIESIQIGIGITVRTGRLHARARLPSSEVEQGAVRADGETFIVAFGDRDRNKALRQPRHIDARRV